MGATTTKVADVCCYNNTEKQREDPNISVPPVAVVTTARGKLWEGRIREREIESFRVIGII